MPRQEDGKQILVGESGTPYVVDTAFMPDDKPYKIEGPASSEDMSIYPLQPELNITKTEGA